MTKANEPHKIITARVAADKVAVLDKLAGHQGRDRSFLINEAIEQYLAQRQWKLAEITGAVAEADAGHYLNQKECEAFMKELAR